MGTTIGAQQARLATVSELERNEVPEWRSCADDRSRMLADAFDNQSPAPMLRHGRRHCRLFWRVVPHRP
jgi:hypothetical protein